MPLNEKQKRKLLKALSPQDAPQILVQELTEKVEEAISKIPTPKDGLRGPQGLKGEPGKDGKSIVGPPGPEGKEGKPGKNGIDGKDAEVDVKELKQDLFLDILKRVPHQGGGQANRNILVASNPSTLSRYTDFNIKPGTNITLTYLNNDNLKTTDLTIAAAGGGTARSISTVSVSSVIAATPSTDIVIIANTGIQVTLPTAVSNTNVYTIKNTAASSVLIATTSGQTIDGSTTILLATQYTSVDLISDNANWNVT